MARPLRIEFAGALYHITARGNARGDIYRDDDDRHEFLALLANVIDRHAWYCHAYCLMGNHYHLLVETGTPSLAKGMKVLNGSYAQSFNQRHGRVGHVLQGRYKAILVQKEAYLLELARYVVLNPVRARMVRSARDWPWSSYRATAGYTQPQALLTTDWILGAFAETRAEAQRRYRGFVQQGHDQPAPWEKLKNQIYLGSDAFVDDMLSRLAPDQSLRDVPKPQRRPVAKALAWYGQNEASRDLAMVRAYLSGHYSQEEIAQQHGVSASTVSRAVKRFERNTGGNAGCKGLTRRTVVTRRTVALRSG